MTQAYYSDADLYCEHCAPNDAEPVQSNETDNPSHCGACHEPLTYTLTPDGVNYVLEDIRESMANQGGWDTVHDCYNGTWYEGSRHVEIVRDWATELGNYFLSDADTKLVERFLDESS